MSEIILKVNNLSKQYRLGTIGTGTISHDLNRWWYKVRGKQDPFLKIGEYNTTTSEVKSDYVWALKDINFEVKRGEVLGIIGKNGAGKSTLLKILSQITSPTTGLIKSKGRIASLLEVGTGFHPEMTGKENIFLNGAILGMTKKEIHSKLEEIVEFSGCKQYINTPVKRYSSGMKVRLAFAVAAHLEPDILVVDEVLAVGDAEFQKKAIGKMQDISKEEGRTVLFVSHDMAAVQNLCATILVLEKGASVFKGDVIDGIDFYLKNNIQYTPKELFKIENRSGDLSSIFSKISFSGVYQGNFYENGNKIYSQSSKVFIDLEIVNKSEAKRKIHIAIDIADSLRIPVSTVNNEFTLNEIYLSGKQTSIRFEIEDFNLRAMNYKLSLWGREVGGRVFDSLKHEVSLDVIETDFFKTGNLPRRKEHGYLLLKNSCRNLS